MSFNGSQLGMARLSFSSVDPDEMTHTHLGLNCLPNSLFTGTSANRILCEFSFVFRICLSMVNSSKLPDYHSAV